MNEVKYRQGFLTVSWDIFVHFLCATQIGYPVVGSCCRKKNPLYREILFLPQSKGYSGAVKYPTAENIIPSTDRVRKKESESQHVCYKANSRLSLKRQQRAKKILLLMLLPIL